MKHPAFQYEFSDLLQKLEQYVTDGWINTVSSGSLKLYNYSHRCQEEKFWNPITLSARGLVLDLKNKKIAATPFSKFFNISEIPDKLPNLPFEAFEKFDGSLIIMFYHEGLWNFCTRGSFTSDQAMWAKSYFSRHNLGQANLDYETTYLFEAIYPENQIVIKYNREYGNEFLSLLGAYKNGYEVDRNELWNTFKDYHVKKLPNDKHEIIVNHALAPLEQGTNLDDLALVAKKVAKWPLTVEGLVIKFHNGTRVKIKSDEYLRTHKLVSRITPLGVWEALLFDDDQEIIRKQLPDEFIKDFDNIVELLTNKHEELLLENDKWFKYCKKDLFLPTKKEFAIKVMNLAPAYLRPLLFLKWDQQVGAMYDKAWKMIRPTGNKLEGHTTTSSMNRIQNDA